MKRELPKLADNERKALLELKKRLKEKFGDRLKKVILYGSKARGDSEPYSDIDIVVEFSNVDMETERMVEDISCEVSSEYDVLTICLVYSTAKLRQRKRLWMPFIENVIREGILI